MTRRVISQLFDGNNVRGVISGLFLTEEIFELISKSLYLRAKNVVRTGLPAYPVAPGRMVNKNFIIMQNLAGDSNDIITLFGVRMWVFHTRPSSLHPERGGGGLQ